MKLTNGVQDLPGRDSRVRGTVKEAFEPSSGASARFAGVLSDVSPRGVSDNLAGAVTGPGKVESGVSKTKLFVGAGAAAKSPISVPPTESRTKAPLVSIDVQPSIASNAGRSIETQTSLAAAGTDNLASSNDLIVMLLCNPNLTKPPPQTTKVAPQPDLEDGGERTFERTGSANTAQSQTGSAQASKSTDRSADIDSPAKNDISQAVPSSDLMAMLLGGLGAPMAQASRDKTTEQTTFNAPGDPLNAAGTSRASDASAILPDAALAQAGSGVSVPAGGPVLSDISVSAHLAPASTSRASSVAIDACTPAIVSPSRTEAADVDGSADARTASAITMTSASGQEAAALRSVAGSGVVPTQSKAPVSRPPSPGRASAADDRYVRSPAGTPTTSEASSSNDLTEGALPDRSMATNSSLPADHDTGPPAQHLSGAAHSAILLVPEHAPPNAVLALTAKVAAAVTELANRPVEAPEVASTGKMAPARSLSLRIEQTGLGPVSIRMHLSGGTLDLHLTASDHDTLAVLQRDRGILASAIGDHHQLHSLTIQDGGAAPTTGGSPVGSGDADGRSRPHTQDTTDQKGDRKNGQSQPRSSARQDGTPETATPSLRTSRRDSLFV